MSVASFVQSIIGEAVSQHCYDVRLIEAVEQEAREQLQREEQAVSTLEELGYAGEDLEDLRRRHPSLDAEELVDWVEFGMSDDESDSEFEEIISHEVEMYSYCMQW